MTKTQALNALKAMGTAQNRKVYARHGVGTNQYGVSYANQKKLAKEIKTDHRLAHQLWASGNHDARVLAAMIADPRKATLRELEAWAKGLENYVQTDSFSGFAAKTPHARRIFDKWSASKDEWKGAAAWTVLTSLAMRDSELPDAFLAKQIGVIERGIHTARNRTRYAMNNALIAIGMRNPELQRQATTAAKRIGVVEVDHGETGCKTPDAVAYIKKAVARKRARSKKA